MSKPFWLLRALTKVKRLANLPDDWTSYECKNPSEIAVNLANEAIAEAWSLRIKPKNIAPMASGGIGIRFQEETKRAHTSIYNNGDMVLSRGSGKPKDENPIKYTEESDVREMMVKVAEFLAQGNISE